MSNKRDELAEIIQDCGEYIPGSHADDYVSPDKAADAILAAGYRKPRTITTAEELDALPVESVVRSATGLVYERYPDDESSELDYWLRIGESRPQTAKRIFLPATVLHEGVSA